MSRLAPFAVLAALATSQVAHAQRDVHLTADGHRHLLEESVPSYGGSVAMMAGGAVLTLVGLGASVFGLAMVAGAAESVYSGIALAIGAMFLVPGLVAVAGGVLLMSFASKRFKAIDAVRNSELRQRNDADGQLLLAVF